MKSKLKFTTKEPLELTKEDGAHRQIQFALIALNAGDYDIAITLAAAAEDMTKGDPEIEITTALQNTHLKTRLDSSLKWSEIYNYERNWLKHKTVKFPSTITITFDDAAFYVWRAIRKLPLTFHSHEMIAFDTWYIDFIKSKKA